MPGHAGNDGQIITVSPSTDVENLGSHCRGAGRRVRSIEIPLPKAGRWRSLNFSQGYLRNVGQNLKNGRASRTRAEGPANKKKEKAMRKALLTTLVSVSLCLMAIGLATAAVAPPSDPISRSQSQPNPKAVAGSRLVLGSGALWTKSPPPRVLPGPWEGIPLVTKAACTGFQTSMCQQELKACRRTAHDPEDRDECVKAYYSCMARCS